jgi:phosphohistidine swiveling domain-containing protein
VRREHQLRNFFFLDMLIVELADRLRTREGTIRMMLPEEVEEHIACGNSPGPAIERREQGCLAVFSRGETVIVTGDEFAVAESSLQTHVSSLNDVGSPQELKGLICSAGRCTGRVRVVGSGTTSGLHQGEILAVQALDPDYFPLLQSVAGVATEEGGITSHGGLVCRQMGIPAVMAIPGLLDKVRDGDLVDLDGWAGTLRVLPTDRDLATGAIVEDWSQARRVGTKASNLNLASQLGWSIPASVVLDYGWVKKALARGAADSIGVLAQVLQARLGVSMSDNLVLRSSALDEDLPGHPSAGRYHTVSGIALPRLAEGLRLFVSENLRRAYRGTILVQPLLHGRVAGVAMSRGPGAQDAERIVVEYAEGTNVSVTSGTGRPGRVTIDRLTGDAEWDGKDCPGIPLDELARAIKDWERLLGGDASIEWLQGDDRLIVLQVRRA